MYWGSHYTDGNLTSRVCRRIINVKQLEKLKCAGKNSQLQFRSLTKTKIPLNFDTNESKIALNRFD